jgi:phenylacetaldehyde dehydrogenase
MMNVLESSADQEKYLAGKGRLFINNHWVEAKSGKTLDVYDPSNGKVIAQVAAADKEDVDEAVKVARAAFETGAWSRLTPSERGRLLWKLADLLERDCEEFAKLESLDNGKPLAFARGDITLAIDMFRYMAGWATKIMGTTTPLSLGFEHHSYTIRESVGVVGQIIPWNFPLLMAAWKLAPALSAGCTVILKPAEQTPMTALKLLLPAIRISTRLPSPDRRRSVR